ncbi:MAG: DUF4349 domain-containing protein [Planctomycetes bacterium]|nr:DUF4349 domain-containing protein [Planctomycetota bacterium]
MALRAAALAAVVLLPACSAVFRDAMPAHEMRASSGLLAVDSDAPSPSLEPRSAKDRKMVRTAELALEVPRADDAVSRCEALIAGKGGWIERKDGAELRCRVPVAVFAEVLAELRAWGRVLRDVVQAEDVTEQHRDLGIRLDNARRSRERLLALLEKADKVEDLLKIESELRRLTEEIESMTAMLQGLESRVALATITVSFHAPQGTDRIARRRPSRFAWINAIGAEHVLRTF